MTKAELIGKIKDYAIACITYYRAEVIAQTHPEQANLALARATAVAALADVEVAITLYVNARVDEAKDGYR